MANRDFEVDEQFLQSLMAGDTAKPAVSPVATAIAPETTAPEASVPEPEQQSSAASTEFEDIFLKEKRLSDRRIVYVSKETYELIVRYLSVISDRRLSLIGYVDNVLSHHVRTYRAEINSLYECRIGCKFFKD